MKYPLTLLAADAPKDKPNILINQGRSTPGPLQRNDIEVVRYPQHAADKRMATAK